MNTQSSIHVRNGTPIAFETSDDGKHVWIRIGDLHQSVAVHVHDYESANALADQFAGVAYVLNPANNLTSNPDL